MKSKLHPVYYMIIGFTISLSFWFIFYQFGRKFVFKQTVWSIGIYRGDSPYDFNDPSDINNPVLTAKNITDVPAIYVADPFVVTDNSAWYMFFEVANKNSKQGDIGLAISNDAINWKYQQIILDEPFHLSFPYVFKWKGEYYMIPESTEANSIRLYRSDDFPTKWTFLCNLIEGNDFVDTSILHYHNKWWLFTTTSLKNNILRLYYADDLKGPWREHIKSPIVRGNAHIARSGGRMIIYNGHIIRYAQDDYPTYGNKLWAIKITELTTTTYNEEKVSENPILKESGSGWNREGMHQIDPYQIKGGKWIAFVDGKITKYVFGSENKFP